jgi:hypothetical protein
MGRPYVLTVDAIELTLLTIANQRVKEVQA